MCTLVVVKYDYEDVQFRMIRKPSKLFKSFRNNV